MCIRDSIVDGPRGVEEGGSLTFGVKTQVGYDIQSVSDVYKRQM